MSNFATNVSATIRMSPGLQTDLTKDKAGTTVDLHTPCDDTVAWKLHTHKHTPTNAFYHKANDPCLFGENDRSVHNDCVLLPVSTHVLL